MGEGVLPGGVEEGGPEGETLIEAALHGHLESGVVALIEVFGVDKAEAEAAYGIEEIDGVSLGDVEMDPVGGKSSGTAVEGFVDDDMLPSIDRVNGFSCGSGADEQETQNQAGEGSAGDVRFHYN
jgi:hypothetical protein